MTTTRRMLALDRLARAKRAFTTRRVALERARILLEGAVRPRAGDLVLARVAAVGAHRSLQLASGRPSTLFEGDEIVLAAGARYAPDQFEAYLPEGLGACDLVAAGGLVGRVVARSERIGEPTRLEALGVLADASGRALNLADFALSPRSSIGRVPTFAAIGTAMNAGKTTAAAHLVRGLTQAGLAVGAAKVTGTGAPGDLALMLDAGAVLALDFTDAGHASTFLLEEAALIDVLHTLHHELQEAGAQAIVLEVADGIYQRESAVLLASPAFRRLVDCTLFAAGDAAGAVAGVRALGALGLPVGAVTGLLTRSPLARQEAATATGLPVLGPVELGRPRILEQLLGRRSSVAVAA